MPTRSTNRLTNLVTWSAIVPPSSSSIQISHPPLSVIQLPTSLLPKKKLSMKWMYKFYSTVSCSLLCITGLCGKFINPFSNARLFFHQGHKLTLGRMPKTRRNFLWLKKIKTVKWKHWEMFACGASWTSNLVQTSFGIFYFSNLMTTSLNSLSIHPWHTSSFHIWTLGLLNEFSWSVT